MDEVTELFRPTGQGEFDLVAESGFRRFPPRLEWQPIFYPVLNREYATFIAREWNTTDAFSGYIGYVLSFAVRSAFLERYDVQKVGDPTALGYWIPSEDLGDFNENIVGKIQMIAVFRKVPLPAAS